MEEKHHKTTDQTDMTGRRKDVEILGKGVGIPVKGVVRMGGNPVRDTPPTILSKNTKI